MSLITKILYTNKVNINAVIARVNQATAEDFNEIKEVVNNLVDAVNWMKCDEADLVAGDNDILFNDAYPVGVPFAIINHDCIDSNGYWVNNTITNKSETGFTINVSKACHLIYLCMPKR